MRGILIFSYYWRFLFLVVGLLTTLISACSSSKKSSKNVDSPVILQKEYELTLSSCTTGRHKFSSTDQKTLLGEYCHTLVDETLNQNCGREERLKLFEQNCSDYKSLLSNSSPNSAPSSAPEATVTNKTKSQNPYGIGISSPQVTVIKKTLDSSFYMHLMHLWTVSLDSYLDRAAEAEQDKIRIAVTDLSECSFDFTGPECNDGYTNTILEQSLIKVNDQIFWYQVNHYGANNQVFAYFYRLKNETELTPSGELYVYFVHSSQFKHLPKAVLDENAGVAVASINFQPMTLKSSLDLAKKSTNLRQKLALLNWSSEQSKFLRPSEKEELKTFIFGEMKNHHEEFLLSGQGKIVHQYFNLKRFWEQRGPFREELQTIALGKFEPLAREEAALALIADDPTHLDDFAVKLWAQAISDKDTNTIDRSLSLVVKEFNGENAAPLPPEEISVKMIFGLNQEDASLATRIYQTLLKMKLNNKHLDILEPMVRSWGLNDVANSYAIDLVEKIATPEAHVVLINQLNNRNSRIAPRIHQSLRSLLLKDEGDVVKALDEQFDHATTYDAKSLCADLANAINSTASLALLIRRLANETGLFLEKIIYLLELKETKDFSPEQHTDMFLKYKESTNDLIMRCVLRSLAKIGTPKSINPVLEKIKNGYTKKLDSFRSELLSLLNSATFSEENIVFLGMGLNKSSQSPDTVSNFFNFLLRINSSKGSVVLISYLESFDDHQRLLVFDEFERRASQGTLAGESAYAWIKYGLEKKDPVIIEKAIHYLTILNDENTLRANIYMAVQTKDTSLKKYFSDLLLTRAPLPQGVFLQLYLALAGGKFAYHHADIVKSNCGTTDCAPSTVTNPDSIDLAIKLINSINQPFTIDELIYNFLMVGSGASSLSISSFTYIASAILGHFIEINGISSINEDTTPNLYRFLKQGNFDKVKKEFKIPPASSGKKRIAIIKLMEMLPSQKNLEFLLTLAANPKEPEDSVQAFNEVIEKMQQDLAQ